MKTFFKIVPGEALIKNAFNSLGYPQRQIAANSETLALIRALQRQKRRTHENYEREMLFLNESIKAHTKSLKPVDAPPTEKPND